MVAKGGHIEFMFLGPPYPAAGSATEPILFAVATNGIIKSSFQFQEKYLLDYHPFCPHLIEPIWKIRVEMNYKMLLWVWTENESNF